MCPVDQADYASDNTDDNELTQNHLVPGMNVEWYYWRGRGLLTDAMRRLRLVSGSTTGYPSRVAKVLKITLHSGCLTFRRLHFLPE